MDIPIEAKTGACVVVGIAEPILAKGKESALGGIEEVCEPLYNLPKKPVELASKIPARLQGNQEFRRKARLPPATPHSVYHLRDDVRTSSEKHVRLNLN